MRVSFFPHGVARRRAGFPVFWPGPAPKRLIVKFRFMTATLWRSFCDGGSVTGGTGARARGNAPTRRPCPTEKTSRLERELEPGHGGVQILALLEDQRVQPVHIDHEIVEHHADVVVQVPVETDGPDLFLATANAPERRGQEPAAGTEVEIEARAARRRFPRPPGILIERKRRDDP